jgi:hypothetical protein
MFVACSNAAPESPPEKTASTSEAITTACTLEHVGAPCDPGTGGGECAGVCALVIGSFGTTVGCVKASSIAANDGKVCGTAANKMSDCTKTCVAGTCTSLPAAKGTPCKPSDDSFTAQTTICDGSCQLPAGSGEMTCVALATTCPKDTDTNDCVYNFCDAKSGACTDIPHPSGATCADGNVCTNNACDDKGTCTVTSFASATTRCITGLACTTGDHCTGTSGECVGDPVVCTPGPVCTTTSCVEPSGCTSTVTPGASCTPTSKCFTAGTCSSAGACTGTTPLDCNDHDPCTTDGCADATGCTHAPIVGCGVDSGVTDTGAIDSGTIVDSGSVVDSGGATDSGAIADSGTGKDSGVGDGGKKDSGSTGGDSGSSLDGATDDGGDGGVDDNADVSLSNGCGCRVAGDSDGDSGAHTRFASIAVAAGVAAILARRRRRA